MLQFYCLFVFTNYFLLHLPCLPVAASNLLLHLSCMSVSTSPKNVADPKTMLFPTVPCPPATRRWPRAAWSATPVTAPGRSRARLTSPPFVSWTSTHSGSWGSWSSWCQLNYTQVGVIGVVGVNFCRLKLVQLE